MRRLEGQVQENTWDLRRGVSTYISLNLLAELGLTSFGRCYLEEFDTFLNGRGILCIITVGTLLPVLYAR
ncbi:hypothetical protein R4I06_01670 [Anaplasma bovis]